MRRSVHFLMIVLALCCICMISMAQEAADTSSRHVSSKYVFAVTAKARKIEDLLNAKTEKALLRFQKHQEKLKRRMFKIDSSAAKEVFNMAENEFNNIQSKLRQSQKFTQYIPLLDTLKTSLKFLDRHKSLLTGGEGKSSKLNESLAKIHSLEKQFQKADEVRKLLKQQRNFLKVELQKFGLSKQFKRLNKDVYYYSEQIKKYKTLVNDKKKIERKAIELLSKTKLFQEFMKKNSMLASLFQMPVDDPNDPIYLQSLSGLQTRVQVNQLIQQQISAGGPGALQHVQNNIQQAQSELLQLKDKMLNRGSSSDDELPDFLPNGQKTKSFFQRLEIGTNTQTQRGTWFFPVTSDLGLSVGYKVNDKSIIGIGASYKVGWGKSFRQIRITHEGAGLRSFVDYQLKRTFWLSGGYEMNYRTAFNRIDQLKGIDGWQQSGLVGVSKKLAVDTKFFKSTKVQLLWDFLSHQQIPRTSPFVFRVGYSFTSIK